jgi:hypothetical protein
VQAFLLPLVTDVRPEFWDPRATEFLTRVYLELASTVIYSWRCPDPEITLIHKITTYILVDIVNPSESSCLSPAYRFLDIKEGKAHVYMFTYYSKTPQATLETMETAPLF